MKIFYVAIVGECDSSRIPISMFDDPAIWTTEDRAQNFALFCRSAGHDAEVRSITLLPSDEWEALKSK